MQVLIISTNRERSPYPVAPVGAMAVASAARAAGHCVDLLDVMFAFSPRRAVRAALRAKRYDVVAFGIRNLDNASYTHSYSYFNDTREIVAAAQESCDAPMVLGGSGFSMAPRQWLERLNVPYGVVGEGEGPFLALLDCLARDADPSALPGVVCRPATAGPSPPPPLPTSTLTPHTSPLTPHPSFSPVVPEFHGPDDFNGCSYRRYLRRGGFVSVQTKRGCPFSCTFCTYPYLEGSTWRCRPPERIVEEIERASRAYPRCSVFFTDSVFNTPREYALDLCRRLADLPVRVPWMAYCNPVGLDEELATAMLLAGCVGIELGFDAVSDPMLASLGKPFTRADISNCLDALSKLRLPHAIHLMFGGPGDTVDEIRDAARFLDAYRRPKAVFASLGVRVYSNTRIHRTACEEGVISPDADLFAPVYYVSPKLGPNPLAALDEVARARPKWSTPTDWARWRLIFLQQLMSRVGSRPQWRHMRRYGEYFRH
ncbi:MAG: radical SAM protein [Planctomycetota bacterium]